MLFRNARLGNGVLGASAMDVTLLPTFGLSSATTTVKTKTKTKRQELSRPRQRPRHQPSRPRPRQQKTCLKTVL